MKMGWELVCRLARPRKLVLHATSEEEALTSAERSGVTTTAVISNGVDVPEPALSLTDSGVLRLLYLGRLEAKKGIENLLMACKRLQDQSRVRWSLTVAGSGDQRYVKRLCRTSMSRRYQTWRESSATSREMPSGHSSKTRISLCSPPTRRTSALWWARLWRMVCP